MRILILNDGRMGHLNQCIAFAKLQDASYAIIDVSYSYKFFKVLSYLLDKLFIYSDQIFKCMIPDEKFDYVVAAGSTSAYPLKVISKMLHAKSVSMMLPQGYRYDLDIIFAQEHDNPPKAANIIAIPANFSFVTPQGFFHASGRSIGIVIGGDNKIFHFSKEKLKQQLDFIFESFQGYAFAVTTSPRTSKEIETLLNEYPFDYKVIYSVNPINPIPDFLDQCERVFITQDSTSMISEAVSFGNAYIEVLPLESNRDTKFSRLVKKLEKGGYLHLFEGSCANANQKINFRDFLGEAGL
jgi:mitochondrial fission protein ELM1